MSKLTFLFIIKEYGGYQVIESYFPFKGYQTYFRIVGEDKRDKIPLILLHGGPGSTHNYFEILDSLAEDRMLIMYDQLGCGNSYVDNREDLWMADTWLEELEALLHHLQLSEVHLLGQSWGGMLAQLYCLKKKNKGIRSLILSSTLASASLWSSQQHERIALMPVEEKEAIYRAERSFDFSSEEYLRANNHFMEMYCAGEIDENAAECLRRECKKGTASYLAAWGPNEYTPTGSLRNYEIQHRLAEIEVPTLIISGTKDLSSPLISKEIFDGIKNSRWELFEGARHMCFVEQTEKYIALVKSFLEEVEK